MMRMTTIGIRMLRKVVLEDKRHKKSRTQYHCPITLTSIVCQVRIVHYSMKIGRIDLSDLYPPL